MISKRTVAMTAVVALVAAGIFAEMRRGAAQPANISNFDPDTMKDFKKPGATQLKKQLSSEQFAVTQQCGTEPPFRNAYWDNHQPGLYVDVVSGEPLFSSLDKFDSGTGWPSFTQPVPGADVVEKKDTALGMERTEVRSGLADSHLGHVFDDGPSPNGQRFCINSAALKFIPLEEMDQSGYGKYLGAFVKAGLIKEPVHATAILAGGCFWGMEEILRKIPGVIKTTVGYTGGTTDDPTYEDVCTGATGHAEAVEIVFDSARLSYESLLDYFYRMHDPTTLNRQHNDVGTQYRSAIFYTSQEQKETAEKVKLRWDKSGKFTRPITTEITAAGKFYPAEEYHQKYLVKNPGGYTCHILRDP
jgi:peptide methionine sulfoxide reductase msrA/msrB